MFTVSATTLQIQGRQYPSLNGGRIAIGDSVHPVLPSYEGEVSVYWGETPTQAPALADLYESAGAE